MKENVIKSKRFVVRQSLIGKNQVIVFTNKKGDTVKYNHDKVYEIKTLSNNTTDVQCKCRPFLFQSMTLGS